MFDWLRDDLPDMPTSTPGCDRPRAEVYDSPRSPVAVLMDTVAHLQLEVEALKSVQAGPSTVASKTLPVRSKPVEFMSTKVPKFGGVTSWDQYRKVFDAIVRSNWWDDAMVALQRMSHLEGDTTDHRAGWQITDASSRGRLGRKAGRPVDIFAIALETLAVKAFGDMGPNARLRLIRDRFVAGHDNCALRRHLDSVPQETPIRDIVDRCRVWESHTDTGVRRIVKPSAERALPVYTVDEPGVYSARPGGGGYYYPSSGTGCTRGVAEMFTSIRTGADTAASPDTHGN